jgi:TolB-like protein
VCSRGGEVAGHPVVGTGGAMNVASVRKALERILASPDFDASARNRRFLEYVVEETPAGRADRLKGLTIAIDVFGRDAKIDPQHDPVVRIEAAKLRRSLERYYLTVGQEDPIRIEIPKGTYVPAFEERGDALAGETVVGAALLASAQRPIRSRRNWPMVAGFALVSCVTVAALVTAAWFWMAGTSSDKDDASAVAGLPPAGPAVVVAPFENLTGTEAGRLFAGGLTHELITNLMRFRDLQVYSASGNERWAKDPAGSGEQLQVNYEVTGSVLRASDRIRLTVQLLEIGSGRYVWSETYDRPLTTADVFGIQEQLAGELAGRLAEPDGIVHKVNAEIFRRHRPETLASYECILQTFAYRRSFSRGLYGSSRECLEDTVRRDPGYPDGWAMLAFALLDEYRWYGFGPLFRQPGALDQALSAAQSARGLDPDSATSLSAYAAVQYYRGEFAEAESAQRRAIGLNPNNPEAWAQLGWRVAFARDWDEGIGLVRQATQQSMIGSGWYHMIVAFDDYRRGDYAAALADMDKAGDLGFFAGPMILAISQAQLGHRNEARQALDRAIALDPTFAQDPRGAFRLHHVPDSLIDQFMDGLRKAGLKIPVA